MEVIEIETPLIQVVPVHETSVAQIGDEWSGWTKMSSLSQESLDVVAQTMKGLSGVCEEKHMSGILGTSGVDRTFRTQGHREHGQRDHDRRAIQVASVGQVWETVRI